MWHYIIFKDGVVIEWKGDMKPYQIAHRNGYTKADIVGYGDGEFFTEK